MLSTMLVYAWYGLRYPAEVSGVSVVEDGGCLLEGCRQVGCRSCYLGFLGLQRERRRSSGRIKCGDDVQLAKIKQTGSPFTEEHVSRER